MNATISVFQISRAMYLTSFQSINPTESSHRENLLVLGETSTPHSALEAKLHQSEKVLGEPSTGE